MSWALLGIGFFAFLLAGAGASEGNIAKVAVGVFGVMSAGFTAWAHAGWKAWVQS